MRKFVQGFKNSLKTQWKKLFDSKNEKLSEGATQEYKSHPHKARGDNWRRPDAHNNKSPKK